MLQYIDIHVAMQHSVKWSSSDSHLGLSSDQRLE